MKPPHVTYKYDLERDIDDIEIGLDTIRNGRQPDNELALLMGQYGENPSREDIKKYLKVRWENNESIKEVVIKQLQEYWDSILVTLVRDMVPDTNMKRIGSLSALTRAH
ncbi:MAG: hypothetical protein UX31_C0005G0010 [Candidatus Nomurabacteria bacterium GW2011_GWA1_46_11]|uniref:Uncharacterized protein n=1 Tax=Candidatus Nomurabacteria bacterium GW2011_GWA1_46_11 TaxID=1618732 RepID=A0A0G1RMQ9_9BACT|nr:MAG: hypothetical protein UX31_C0005G0010 [Candidatus Nomurabacteria bacterium GW2011_GWA1_46_11]